ncbi:MAG: hypothetical protein E7045_03875 [Lentisphaerae bacterium]|nr:hypothetical protein [Lentisphaerota bacterium]
MMKKLNLFMSATLLILAVGCTSILESVSPSDITLEQLQSKKDRAADPDGRFAKAESYIMRQQVSDDSIFGGTPVKIIELKYRRPDKLKCTVSIEGEPISGYIINGSSAWNIDYKSRKVMPIAPQNMQQIRTLTRLNTPASRYTDVFKNVKLERCTTAEDSFYKLTCSNNPDNIIEIYIDADTFLTARMRVSLKLPAGTVKTDTVMKSYSLYEGVRIADESVATTGDDSQKQKTIYYKLDAQIADSEFTPPVL